MPTTFFSRLESRPRILVQGVLLAAGLFIPLSILASAIMEQLPGGWCSSGHVSPLGEPCTSPLAYSLLLILSLGPSPVALMFVGPGVYDVFPTEQSAFLALRVLSLLVFASFSALVHLVLGRTWGMVVFVVTWTLLNVGLAMVGAMLLVTG
jgi:hypothetical protein